MPGPRAPRDAGRPILAWAVRMTIIALLLGAGAWLVLELDRSRRALECLESGQSRCRIISGTRF